RQSLLRDQHIHFFRTGVADLFLDIGEAVAIGRNHPSLPVGNHELSTGKCKPTLLVSNCESGVVNQEIKYLAREFHWGRFEDRYFRILLAIYASKAKVGSTRLHLYPFILELLEMNVTLVQCSNDIKKFACLNTHRARLLYLGFGVTSYGDIEIGAQDSNLIFSQAFDQNIRQDRNGGLPFHDALDEPEFFLQNTLF